MDIEWFRSRWFPIAFAGAMFGLLVYLSHPQHPPVSRTSWRRRGCTESGCLKPTHDVYAVFEFSQGNVVEGMFKSITQRGLTELPHVDECAFGKFQVIDFTDLKSTSTCSGLPNSVLIGA